MLASRKGEEEALCAICADGTSVEPNVIVFCERCDMAVHQLCYGIEEIPSGEAAPRMKASQFVGTSCFRGQYCSCGNDRSCSQWTSRHLSQQTQSPSSMADAHVHIGPWQSACPQEGHPQCNPPLQRPLAKCNNIKQCTLKQDADQRVFLFLLCGRMQPLVIGVQLTVRRSGEHSLDM